MNLTPLFHPFLRCLNNERNAKMSQLILIHLWGEVFVVVATSSSFGASAPSTSPAPTTARVNKVWAIMDEEPVRGRAPFRRDSQYRAAAPRSLAP